MTRLTEGTNLVTAFGVAGRYGLQASTLLQGTGRGPGGSILRQRDGSASAASRRLVPSKTGSTNPLYVARVTGKSGVVVSGLVIAGGKQGVLYNGLRVEKTSHPQVSELRVVAVPGDSDVPPGETFGINFWRVVAPLLHDVEVDGQGVGASGLGYNSCSGGSTTRYTGHDHPHCKAVALWQHTGGHVFDRVESLNNAFGYGFERCTGDFRLLANKFRGSTRADIHLASDTGRCRVHVVDPDLGNLGRLRVFLPKTEMRRPNRQLSSDVTLTINGRDRRDLIDFSTRA